MLNRRSFLRKAVLGSGLILTGGLPLESIAGERKYKLTVLHTNDLHSRLEPFPADGGRLAGQGGAAARATLINQIRQTEEHVLLFDAGDIFQGTPYFNLYKGEPEIKSLSMMGYDAVTMGNHDFDAGADGFARQLIHADFPVLTANYDFANTPLEGKTKSWTVIRKANIRIGIFGLGIELKGLVAAEAYGHTRYLDPVHTANTIAAHLKEKEHCDFIICLSHLGYSYPHDKVSDQVIARSTTYINLIIGGHTHTFLEEPKLVRNRAGEAVFITQAGWGGVRLGRMDFVFTSKKKSKLTNAQSVIVGKQTIG